MITATIITIIMATGTIIIMISAPFASAAASALPPQAGEEKKMHGLSFPPPFTGEVARRAGGGR
jgi:hypothetical protein